MDTQENDPFSSIRPTPSAARPLLGLTALVIEDSRFACEALRLLCLRSGARIRRADSIRSAKRHLQVYRPGLVMVDLGLPDGNGAELIRELAEGSPRPEVILGLSGDPDGEASAMEAGADGFIAKPISNLTAFQKAVLEHLPRDRHPSMLQIVSEEEIEPDILAFQDDMAHVAEVLETRQDERAVDYVAQFLGGVARIAKDSDLESAASALAIKRAQGAAAASELAHLSGLVQERLNARLVI